MMHRLFYTFALIPGMAIAEPKVVVDILPLHSLTAQVMAGVGTPEVLMRPNASAHNIQLRPSQVRSLSQADLVIWTGTMQGPDFVERVSATAPDAVHMDVNTVAGLTLLPTREAAVFEHDHDHGGHDDHDDHDEHKHDDHDEHAEHKHDDHDEHAEHKHDDHDEHAEHQHDDHDEHAEHKHDDHDEHAEHKHDDHDEHEEHAHGSVDPHTWLDPENAKLWLHAISEVLEEIDPANAATYHANAQAAIADLDAVAHSLEDTLGGANAPNYLLGHDAFQYFEARFGLKVAGAVTAFDESTPGPARLQALRAAVADGKVDCLISEPIADDRLLATVTEGTPIPLVEIDQLGRDQEPGPAHYSNLLNAVATGFADCAKLPQN